MRLDYHGPVQIIRYANRLEIRNPGFSLKSPEHFGEPGSQPRNPKIAAVLHETRFAETKGSGIRVMRESMDQAFLRKKTSPGWPVSAAPQPGRRAPELRAPELPVPLDA